MLPSRPSSSSPKLSSINLLLSLLSLVAFLLQPAAAARITFHLPPTSPLPHYNPSALPSSTRATLFRHANTVSAPLTRRNMFQFANVTQGSWLFTVQCRDYNFGPLRIDVFPAPEPDAQGNKQETIEAYQTFWGNEWGNKGEFRGGATHVVQDAGATFDLDGAEAAAHTVLIEVWPERAKEYYSHRGGFSPLDFLKSPMILMALFSLVLIIGLPYLTENMDEETRAEFEEISKKSPMVQATNQAGGLQNFDLASWMAGKSAGASSSGGSGGSSSRG